MTIADISADEMRRGGVAGGVSGSGRRLLAAAVKVDRLLTRFTCFTGTKAVHILTFHLRTAAVKVDLEIQSTASRARPSIEDINRELAAVGLPPATLLDPSKPRPPKSTPAMTVIEQPPKSHWPWWAILLTQSRVYLLAT